MSEYKCGCPRCYPSSYAAKVHKEDCPNKPQIRIHDGYINEIVKLQAEIAELKSNNEILLHQVNQLTDDNQYLQQQLKEARKEAFNAGRRDKKGCVVQIDYKDGGFEFPRLEDFLATKEPTK